MEICLQGCRCSRSEFSLLSWGRSQNREILDILKRALGTRYFDEMAQAPFYPLARHFYNGISYNRDNIKSR